MTTPLVPEVEVFLALASPGRDDVRAIVRKLALWIGGGFHPDTPAEDYVGPDGESVFSAADAVRLNKVLQIAYSFDDLDPSEVAFDALYPDGIAAAFATT